MVCKSAGGFSRCPCARADLSQIGTLALDGIVGRSSANNLDAVGHYRRRLSILKHCGGILIFIAERWRIRHKDENEVSYTRFV
jgi:hypothetical protein